MAEVDIAYVVQKTLEELINNKLIPKHEEYEVNILDVLKEAAQMEATLTTKMVPMIDNHNMQEVEKAISAIIGCRFGELIRDPFVVEAHRMEVAKKFDGQSVVQIHREGVEFHSEIMLITTNDIYITASLQLASLVIELLFFLLKCLGIGIGLSEAEMKALVQKVKRLVREPAFQRAFNKCVDAWNKAGGSAWLKAKAICSFLKDSYLLGILWKIIALIFKLIYEKSPSWEVIKAIIEVVLMIVAAFTTNGSALIARIALAVHNDDQLAKKIAYLVKLSDMKEAVAAAKIKDLLKKASTELKKYQLIPEYDSHKQNIRDVLEEAATMETTLTADMVHMIDNKTMQDVEEATSAIIGWDRVKFITSSFLIETYRMEVVEKFDGPSVVQVHRQGSEFHSEIKLVSIKEIERATVLQWASLVLELFFFVLSCVGTRVDQSEDEITLLVQEVEYLVEEPLFQAALNTFLEAWKEAKGSAKQKAKAIFYLLKDCYSLGYFWVIIKLICTDRSKSEMIKAIAEVALMIVAAFTTEGLALIARLAIALDNAGYLKDKIANLVMFSNMTKQ